MTDPLREAAQAVVKAWGPSGGPEWDWMNRRIDRLRAALDQPADPDYCDVCPHAMWLHNPDGSCPCGVLCQMVVNPALAAPLDDWKRKHELGEEENVRLLAAQTRMMGRIEDLERQLDAAPAAPLDRDRLARALRKVYRVASTSDYAEAIADAYEEDHR